MNIKELFSGFKDEDFFSKVNLHMHSNFSDGVCDFDKLIEDAHKTNLKYISITDHNSVLGYKKTKYQNDPILIKGVEFDCIMGLTLAHILGYGVDIENEKLNSLCAKNELEQKNDIIRLLKSRHPKRVIEAIHASGGIAVLAHPCCCNTISLNRFIGKLVSFGLDGIETRYPYDRFRSVVKFSPRAHAKELALKYNLIQTGGSDEHGYLKECKE